MRISSPETLKLKCFHFIFIRKVPTIISRVILIVIRFWHIQTDICTCNGLITSSRLGITTLKQWMIAFHSTAQCNSVCRSCSCFLCKMVLSLVDTISFFVSCTHSFVLFFNSFKVCVQCLLQTTLFFPLNVALNDYFSIPPRQ